MFERHQVAVIAQRMRETNNPLGPLTHAAISPRSSATHTR